MSGIICPICGQHSTIYNKHHICPKAYGGDPKGALLTLCENCHKGIHYTAEAEYSNKKSSYFQGEVLNNARPYIEAIKKAKDLFERTIGADHLLKKVIVEVPQGLLVKMHKRKSGLGFKALDKYLISLIEQDCKRL